MMSRKRLIIIGAGIMIFMALCLLAFWVSIPKRADFDATLETWASIVMRQDSRLKALCLGENSNFYVGVFKGESNLLFLGCYQRNFFTNGSVSQCSLRDTNGLVVDYKFEGPLLYTNVVQKLSSRGLETDSQAYCFGMYVKLASDVKLSEFEFTGGAGSELTNKMVLHLPAE
jgi:hypothetical protein